MQNHRSFIRTFGVAMMSLTLSLGGTTFSGALAADNITDKGAMNQVFILPADREQTPENVAQVSKQLEMGRKSMQKQEYDKAISCFQEAYGLAREIKHGEGEGEALTQMCLFYQQKGQIPRAKELGEHAIEVLADTPNKKLLGEARTAVAGVYLAQDNTYMAIQQLELAMQAFSNLGATDGESAATVLLVAANLGVKTGHVKEALQFFEAAANYLGQAGKTKNQITTQLQVVDMLMQLGLQTAALEEANKALTNARQTKSPDEMVAALAAVANAQYCLCEFPNARKAYEELLQIKVPGQTLGQRAKLVEGYAFCLAATGDLDQAKVQLDRVLPVLRKEGDAYSRAVTENALGVINSLNNNSAVAIQHLRNALESVSIINPKADRLSSIISQNLAATMARAGQNRAARNQYNNTLQLCHNKKFHDPLTEGRTYAALAEVCLNLKEYPDAEQAVKAGIAVAEKLNDDAALWRLYTSLAQIQVATQQSPAESLQSALSFFRSAQAGDFANPTELTYPTRREDKAFELVSALVAAGLTEQALLTAEQLKQEAFINEWHRRGGEVRAADRDIYEDMVSRRAHLHAMEGSGSPPHMVLKDWRDWVVRFQHVAAENPTLARLIAPVPINLSEVMKTLQAHHACTIDYLVGPRSSIAFVIDTNRKLTAVSLPCAKDEIQQQVASLLTASGKSDESARATEHRTLQLLYNELIPPELTNIMPSNPEQMVVVIPDAGLYNLPFAALLSPSGKFLVESHTLTMAPELGMLANIPRSTKDVSVLMATPGSTEENETGQIASVLEPAQVTTLAGKDAEINTLQEQAKTNSIIHFAAAMKIAQNNPLNSVFPLNSAEAGTPVTAKSLFELTLPSELAVLSGTSVNAKDYRGNGVQVFCRGLNYAGVRNVLMSLWAGPDANRTSELVEFYRSRQAGLSQAQSLRKAQLLALSKNPSPRSWAAFQLLGPGF